MKTTFSRICLFCAVFPLFAQISFLSPDINARNDVLFSIKADIPGRESYKTLFLHSIDTGKMDQLTFFPETMESLSGGTVLQLRNRFGTGRYSLKTSSFSWLDGSNPFFAGGSVGFGSISDIKSSPDGRWQIAVEPETPARGKLVLLDAERGSRHILSSSVERGAIPVSWSPDSSVLVYSLEGILYFARPESFFSPSLIDAGYRTIGKGSINCVSWFSSSRLLYISGTTVYRIQASELFARSLYTPLIGIGEMAGKLPGEFDPATDVFCSSADGTAILYARNNRNVYYCTLGGDDYTSATRPALLPYLLLPGNTASLSFVWPPDGKPAVFAHSVEDGRKTVKAWHLADFSGGKIFSPLSIPYGTVGVSPSRDGSLASFFAAGNLFVYNTANWKEIASWRDEPVVSAAWGEDSYLFVGGTETVRRWNYRTGTSTLLLLSSAVASGWDEQGLQVLADTKKLGRFTYNSNMNWTAAAAARLRTDGSSANASWRIYLDSGKGYFSNMIYARSATSPGGTRPLVPEPERKLDSLAPDPRQGDPVASAGSVFSHGSRTNSRQVAVVFDAVDSLDGLPGILQVLEQYKIRATFFINGEFIRRHPVAVNEIVKAGHQCASLFFTSWDLTGPEYRIDEDFIVRGLSRNEDDFYTATGQELTLLWHAPNYVTSPLIVAAGEKAGYRYVSGDVTVLDWVSGKQSRDLPGFYRSSAIIIEEILAAKKPGSIIPVRIGKVEGGRSDYLYEKIGQLVNALTEAGYRIVTVDELVSNGR